MNIKRAFIAMLRAIDCLNDEQPNNEMKNFILDADPYIFKDRTSAIADVQFEFENCKSLIKFKNFNNLDELYDSIYDYLNEYTSFAERFTEISKEEWSNLCSMVDTECDDEQVLM
jgi:hypothetical protein